MKFLIYKTMFYVNFLKWIFFATGPYTVFIPSDRAFDKLLIHLGGAEKAEQKFKENPRLLSGVSVQENKYI